METSAPAPGGAAAAATGSALERLVPAAVVAITGFLQMRELVALTGTCRALRVPEAWAVRGRAAVTAAGFEPSEPVLAALTTDGSCIKAQVGPLRVLSERLARAAALSPCGAAAATAVAAIVSAAGCPSAAMNMAWAESSEYWMRDMPDKSSLFGTVTRLRSVWWFHVYGDLWVPRGRHVIVARVRMSSFWGDAVDRTLVKSDEGALPLPAAAAAAGAAGGAAAAAAVPPAAVEFFPPTHPLDSREMPQGVWSWVYMGVVSVTGVPAARIGWNLRDVTSSQKSGLDLDLVAAVAEEECATLLGFNAQDLEARDAVAVHTPFRAMTLAPLIRDITGGRPPAPAAGGGTAAGGGGGGGAS